MTKFRWWAVLILISAGVIGMDIVTDAYILFPIVLVIPVALATWHLGRWPGIGFALMLVGCRLAIALALEAEVYPAWAVMVNAAIRAVVLVGLALLIAKVAQQQRALAQRVEVLEGILPICSFCKKIRLPDGRWEQIEGYVSNRSAVKFSHGFCEECGRRHYGELLGTDHSDGIMRLGQAATETVIMAGPEPPPGTRRTHCARAAE